MTFDYKVNICWALKHFYSTWLSISSLCGWETLRTKQYSFLLVVLARITACHFWNFLLAHYLQAVEMKATWCCRSLLQYSQAYAIQRCTKAQSWKVQKELETIYTRTKQQIQLWWSFCTEMADTQESCTDTQESSTCTAHSRAHTQQTTLVPVALLQHIAGSYSDLYFVGKLGTRSSTSEAMRSPQRTESAKTAHTQRNMFNDGDNETINLSLLTVSSLGTSHRTWPFTQSSSIHVRISLEWTSNTDHIHIAYAVCGDRTWLTFAYGEHVWHADTWRYSSTSSKAKRTTAQNTRNRRPPILA